MSQLSNQPIFIAGKFTASDSKEFFQSTNPTTGQANAEQFPISTWSEIESCLEMAADAYDKMRDLDGGEIAKFLEAYADAIDANASDLADTAASESGLPVSPRLKDVEIPRTSGQLRQAATAARTGSWTAPIIDTKLNIRACYESLGPVCVFGPNNFPFAFNSIAGGDFAAAIAAGNPVIAKANTSHPHTTLKLAELAAEALKQTQLPAACVQLIYRTSHADGEKMVADHRIAACGYTGSRHAGLKLKAAADKAGKPFYAELSAINPVVFLPGAIAERGEALAQEYVGSGLMGTGQFCTNPGLLIVAKDSASDKFVDSISQQYEAAKDGTLLSPSVRKSLQAGVDQIKNAGAKLLVGGRTCDEPRVAFSNTVLQVEGSSFIANSQAFQAEMFGNAVLIVRCDDVLQMVELIKTLEGNLTGCIYSAKDGSDDSAYALVAKHLVQRVGRLLNDKMPTGVAVSAAMNHGGPYPATAHPNFTAVGIPSSICRFAKLSCFDAVRPERLPKVLRDQSPNEDLWRNVDGGWKTGNV